MNGTKNGTSRVCGFGVVIFVAVATALIGLSPGYGQNADGARTGKNAGDVPNGSTRAFTHLYDFLAAEEIPMAETIWKATNIGDFGVAANWTNGVPGAAAGKVAVFDGSQSQTSVASGLDQSGAANSFKIKTTPAYFGNIGGPGNPLKIKVTADALSMTIRNPGQNFLEGTGANFFAVFDQDAAGGALTELGNSSLNILVLKAGRLILLSDTSVPGFAVVSGVNAELIVEQASNPTATPAPVFWHLEIGTIICKRDLPTSKSYIQMSGGTFRMEGINEKQVMGISGGVFKYAPGADPAAFSPDLIVTGQALWDASESPFAIPLGFFVKGRFATVRGTIIADTAGLIDIDLNQPYP